MENLALKTILLKQTPFKLAFNSIYNIVTLIILYSSIMTPTKTCNQLIDYY